MGLDLYSAYILVFSLSLVPSYVGQGTSFPYRAMGEDRKVLLGELLPKEVDREGWGRKGR